MSLLAGKRVLVGGASQGIGLGIARGFLQAGAELVLTARTSEHLASVQAMLTQEYGDRVSAVATDLALSGEAARLLSALGRLDVVIANFGATDTMPGFDTSDAEWARLMDANLTGPAALAREAARDMARHGSGAILFIGSIAGRECLGAPIAYAAGKAGLRAVMKTMARELAPAGVRVNMISPGNVIFDGGRWAAKRAADPQGIDAAIERLVPMRRFGHPEEIAAVAVFLCSDQASFVTGVDMAVDGGQTIAM